MSRKSPKYIYESPDGGKTVYRRHFLNYENPRQLVKDESGFLVAENISKKMMESMKTVGVWFEY